MPQNLLAIQSYKILTQRTVWIIQCVNRDERWRTDVSGWTYVDGHLWTDVGGWKYVDGHRWMDVCGQMSVDGSMWMDIGGWTYVDGHRWMEGARQMELDGRTIMDIGWNEDERQTEWRRTSNGTTKQTATTTNCTGNDTAKWSASTSFIAMACKRKEKNVFLLFHVFVFFYSLLLLLPKLL